MSKIGARLGTGVAMLMVVAVIFALGYFIGQRAARSGVHAESKAVEEGQKVLYWSCSMHPQVHLPEFGKCPICFMDLIPVKASGEEEGKPVLVLTAKAKELAEIQTSPVERKFVAAEIRMVGKVDYDETRLADISAYVGGRIDRLYVDYTGIPVRKGDHMVYLYSPDVYAAQQELLQSLKAAKEMQGAEAGLMKDTAKGMVEASREKLRLMGLKKDQIEEIETRGTPADHITIYAPIGGIVIEKSAVEGSYVQVGMRIYRIADLSRVWVKLDAYESDLVWLRRGQKVTFTTEAYPGETFAGQIAFLDPVLNAATRTVKVRVNVPNSEGKLKPEMFVRGIARATVAAGGRVMDPDLAGKWMCPMHPEIVKDAAGACDVCEMPLVRSESLGYVPVTEAEAAKPLVIPASAPLLTGERAVVYVERNPLLFLPESPVDWSALAAKLRAQGQAAGPSPGRRLWEMLDAGLKAKLAALPSPPVLKNDLVAPLAAELNRVLAQRDLYEAAAWERLQIAKEAAPFLKQGIASLSEQEVIRFNRWLLEKAFPDAIPRVKELPTYVGREVVLGPRAGDSYIVREGLSEGERVVTRGNFRIDSALQIQAKPSMMAPGGIGGALAPRGAAAPKAPPVVAMKAPVEFQAQLGKLLESYLAVQTALAKDDAPAAAKGVGAVRQALDAVDMKLLDGPAHAVWMKELPDLQKALDAMAKAKDLQGLRSGFALFSEALPAAIRTFGLSPARTLYVLHCPMAFQNRGANWLQPDPETRNPYFGAEMPRCGDVVGKIE